MGAVFRARQPSLGRDVAVKVMLAPPENADGWRERFAREARTLARLSHPGIVTVHDFGQDDDMAWIVMEFVQGTNLRQLMSEGRLSPEEALSIAGPICAALGFAHERGVVHRDIKPENVLVDTDGRVKLVDFGLAQVAGPDDQRLSRVGQALGTPRYMAPEQLDRPLEVDHRADIFSLGVVLYELLTGQVPAGVVEPPSRKVQVDVRIDEVVLRALEREPERRYQRARDFESRIGEVQERRSGSPATSTPANGLRTNEPTYGFGYVDLAALVGIATFGVLQARFASAFGSPESRSTMIEVFADPQTLHFLAPVGLAALCAIPILTGIVTLYQRRRRREGEPSAALHLPMIHTLTAILGAGASFALVESARGTGAFLELTETDAAASSAFLTRFRAETVALLVIALLAATIGRGAHRSLLGSRDSRWLHAAPFALSAVPAGIATHMLFDHDAWTGSIGLSIEGPRLSFVLMGFVTAFLVSLALILGRRFRAAGATVAVGLTAAVLLKVALDVQLGMAGPSLLSASLLAIALEIPLLVATRAPITNRTR